MNNSRTMNSLKNIIAGFGGQFITLLTGFINRIIFVRVLSEAYLGVNGLFTNVLTMLSLTELGISTAITYALYKPLAKNDTEKVATLMHFYKSAYTIIGIVVGILGICLLPFLKYIISDPGNIKENLYIIYIIFLFNTTIGYFYSYKTPLIIADQKNYIVSIISYSVILVQSIFQILILLITKNYIIYLICQSIGTVMTNILISRKANKLYPYLKNKNIQPLTKEDKKSLFVNIKALVIVKLSGVLVNSTDNIIISATKGLGLVSTGVASNYNLLVSTLNTVLNQIFSGITASVGNLNAIESNERKKEFFDIINLMNFWLYGWCTVSFIFLATDIVNLLFGQRYILSTAVVIIIAINFYTVGMQSAVWTYKNTLGLFDYGKYLTLLTGLINIVLSIFLGQKLGLFGIFAATLISRLLTNIWYDPYAVFKYGLKRKMKEYIKKYVYYLLVLSLTIGIMYFIVSFFKLNFFIKLIVCICLPHCIFFIFFYRFVECRYLMGKLYFLVKKFIKFNK